MEEELKQRYGIFLAWHRRHQYRLPFFRAVIVAMLALAIMAVPSVRDLANENVGAMTALAVLAAGWYAWITRGGAGTTALN